MSSGYVTTNLGRKPDQVRANKLSPVSVDLSAVNPLWKFSLNEMSFNNPITSYRSGPSYEREASKPGAVFSDQNIGEFLASQAGDIGHEFSCKKVTRLSGNSFSRRPDPIASPLWGKLTSPVHFCFTAPSSSNDLNGNRWLDRANSSSDLNWGFVKSDSDLVTLGTSFVKSTNPIQSQVNLLSDIAEALVDGALIPELLGKTIVSSVIDPRKRRELIKAVGGEYLNFIFGYKPLADDAAKVGVLVDTVNGLIDQWIKDSGTIVRRRRRVPGVFKADSSRELSFSFPTCTNFAFWPSVPGRVYNLPYVQYPGWQDSSTAGSKMSLQGLMASRVSSEITFSAGYEFDVTKMFLDVPSGESAADLMHNAALRDDLKEIAFGLDPASILTALYDATPFSWLLDWFANIGDILDNFRGLNLRGVQLLWGYITETVIRESYFEYALTWNPTGNIFFRTNGFFDQKSIRRIRATPFGFGTSFGSLSASQSATLAALAAAKS
jgi:hypothetical protein